MPVLVCDTYHGNLDGTEPDAGNVERVVLSRDEARKSRLRASTEAGRELGIALDRRLTDGDVIHDDEVAVVVEIEPVESFAVDVDRLETDDAFALGHALGNAHEEASVERGVAYVPVTPDSEGIVGELPDEAVRRTETDPSVFDEHDDGHRHGHGHGEGDHSHRDTKGAHEL